VAETTRIALDGKPIDLPADASLAAGLIGHRELVCGRSPSGRLRAPLCGMGICHECRATVDGRPGVRTCLEPARGVRTVERETRLPAAEAAWTRSERAVDVLVVGAGPAGLAAAAEAGERGRRVLVVDDNRAAGGQIWRGKTGRAGELEQRCSRAGVEFLARTSLALRLGERHLRLVGPREVLDLRCSAIVLASGATERFLPFPGWELPGVLGLGGLQALIKDGLDVRGRRVVLAGSGPLLLAVAALVQQRGGLVRRVAEQAPNDRVAGFVLGLAAHPSKLAQALALRVRLGSVPFAYSNWPLEARGAGRLETLTLRRPSGTESIDCDLAGIGFGLLPNARPAALLGCRLERGAVAVDPAQETSVEGVFAAGECTGVGGLDKALLEGRSAGAAAAGDRDLARALAGRLARERRFAARLEQAFALRDELRALPRPETIVCRCEDVRWGELASRPDWTDAKLQTRCGMGPCQGRVCAPALEFLRGWAVGDARPPLVPVPCGALVHPPGTGADGA